MDEYGHLIYDLQTRRIDLGLTQVETAELAGTNRCSVQKWETHRRVPSIESVLKWATALGMKIQLTLT